MEENAEEKKETRSSYRKRPAWQWILIYLIVAVVIYGLIYYFVLGKKTNIPYSTTNEIVPGEQINGSSPPSSEETMESEVSVTLTSKGFSPQTITIKAATIVTWTNQSGTAASVNSAVHPTHQVYPPLNLGEFEDGGSLSLVFDSPGTYKYHNHLNPTQVGTIIVE